MVAVPNFGFSALVVTCLILLYHYIIYPAFISPLANIPNAHWTSSFSPLWILYQRFRERNNQTTYAAHQKHGSIVRLGSNELSVDCVDGGIKTIYAGGFDKHEWYMNQFPNYGVVNMFSTKENQPHSVKKRTIANIYSKSVLQSSEQLKANSVVILRERFLPILTRLADTGEEVDVHDLNNALTMDFMSAYQFGLANSTNFLQNVQLRRKYLWEYHSRRHYAFYHAELPRLMAWSKLLGRWRLVPESTQASNRFLEGWGSGMAKSADCHLGDVENAGDVPVVYKQYKNGVIKLVEKESGGSPRTAEEQDLLNRTIYSEMLDHVSAGHETSAIALTYLYLEMSRRPQLQQQLRAEIATLTPRLLWPPAQDRPFVLPDAKQIDALPLLHAILMETLRLHAPIPGMEPRVTPPRGCTLAGYENIPGNVRVSAMPYTLHRNPTVFPNPEQWKPERWMIDSTSEEHKEMMRWFWAFGSGGRMCIGSHFATQEIKLVVCAVYGNFETRIAEGGDVGVEELDAYTTRPGSNRLGLHFVKV